MPDSTGLASYTGSDQIIPATMDGQPGSYLRVMYLESSGSVAAKRELLGKTTFCSTHRVSRYVADVEALYSYEGTREMKAVITGKAITGFSAFV